MATKVNIIGAGTYGLALGSYLQMNGFDTEIFEMHDLPGGLCTAWQRKGYTFDACIHWLLGSSPGINLHEMWKELHAVQDRQFVEWDVFAQVKTSSGETLTIYTDPGKLELEMLRIAPEDSAQIQKLCKAIRTIAKADMIVTNEKMGFLKRMKAILPWLTAGPILKKYSKISIDTFFKKLKNPVLKEAIGRMYGGSETDSNGESSEGMALVALVMMLAFMSKGSAGYPIGGSLEFSRAIEKRFLDLGGKINYKSPVERIIVENDTAVGVVSNGVEYRSDVVISCADGHKTLFDMLGGKYFSKEQWDAYQNYPIFPSLIYVSLGIDKDLSGLPHMSMFPLKEDIVLEEGSLILKQLSLRLFSFDPTMAPDGKTAGIVMIESRGYEYWKTLRENDPEGYREEKRKVGEQIVDAIDLEYGDIKDHVEVIDVATPATWERYTGNWKGSYEGFLPTKDTMMENLGFTVPGLSNFYMHSQWVSVGGGLPPAGSNGRALAKILCKKYGIKFQTVP